MDFQNHRKKFSNTEALIHEAVMEIETTTHFDWLAVMMYYSCLHLVHSHCANRKTPYHPQNHTQVLNEARRVKKGAVVQAEMWVLYNASMDARYEDKFLGKQDLEELKKSYDTIKAILAS